MSVTRISTAEWHPDTFQSLRTLILQGWRDANMANTLRDKLQQIKSNLTKFDANPPNAQQRDDLAKHGVVYINGKAHKGSENFNYNVLLLSDLLAIEEDLASTVLYHAEAQMARLGRGLIESAVFLYHTERLEQLECLNLILQGGSEATGLPPSCREVFSRFIVGDVLGNDFVAKLIDNIHAYFNQISQVPTKVMGPAPNLPPHPPKTIQDACKESSVDSPVDIHLAFLGQEIRMMGNLLVLMVKLTPTPNPTDTTKILSHLQEIQLQKLPYDNHSYIMTRNPPPLPPSPIQVDATLQYFYSAFISTLDPTSIYSTEPQDTVWRNKQLMTTLQQEISGQKWKSPMVKSLVQWAWSTWLRRMLTVDPSGASAFPTTSGITVERAEHIMEECVKNDVFFILREQVLAFKSSTLTAPTSTAVLSHISSDVQSEFETQILLPDLDLLMKFFIQDFGRLIRRWKAMEEDAKSLTDLHTPYADLLHLIHHQFKDRLDAGLDFWTEPLLIAFLKLATESRTALTRKFMFDVLASLATGPQSSAECFKFLGGGSLHDQIYGSSSGALRWGSLYSAVAAFVRIFTTPSPVPYEFEPSEVQVLKSFLRVLRQVVLHSSDARTLLFSTPPIPMQQRTIGQQPGMTQAVSANVEDGDPFLALLACPIPLTLKAALCETLEAFCVDQTCAAKIWTTMENRQLLPTWSFSSPRVLQHVSVKNIQYPGQLPQQQTTRSAWKTEGLIRDLELEERGQSIALTQALVSIFTTMIASTQGTGPILANLGANRRRIGVWPYVDFVLWQVFARLDKFVFSKPQDKWKLVDRCLKFIEKCLDTVDFQTFEQLAMLESQNKSIPSADGPTSHQKEMLAIATSPGFQVYLAFLSGGQGILASLFDVVKEGVVSYNADSFGTLFHRSSVIRVLRITNQILAWQNVVRDVCTSLQDLIAQPPPSNGTTPPTDFSSIEFPSQPVQGMDQYLIYHQQDVINLAGLVAAVPWYNDLDDAAHLAVRLLLLLSSSPSFGASPSHGSIIGLDNRGNRLVRILASSPQASLIQNGFMERLATTEAPETRLSAQEFYFSGLDDVERSVQPLGLLGVSNDEVELVMGQFKTAGPRHHYSQGHLDKSVRGEMMELVLKNLLDKNRVPPTLSHWLLGYNVSGPLKDSKFSDPKSNPTAQVGLLHVLLDLVRPHVNDDFPTLVEQCLHVLCALCEDLTTSDPTMRYLSTVEDFFQTQLSQISTDFLGPSKDLASLDLQVMEEQFLQDGDASNVNERMQNHLRTLNLQNAWIMFARLHQRAWLLKMVALDLKRSAQLGQRSQTSRILHLLYDTPSLSDQFNEMEEQRMMKSLDILNSVDLTWGMDPSPRPRSALFDSLDFSTFLTTNERGCPVYDIRLAWATLLSMQRSQESRGTMTQAQRDASTKEMQHILRNLLEENYARELFFAQRNCLRAWKDMIAVTLSDQAFPLLPPDQRETIVYELLQAILPKMNAEDTSGLIAEDMAELVGLLVAKLANLRREEGVHLPLDMLAPVLQGVLAAILRNDASGYMRGHLYSALLSLLQLDQGVQMDPDSFDAAVSLVKRDSPVVSQTTFWGLVTNAGDLLLDLLATDAMDADEDVWKVTAYACLDAICNLSFSFNARNDRVLGYLVRRNYLGLFILVLRREDEQLQRLMQQETNDLNALYVYEQKMALFTRFASHREGAGKLLDAGIMEALASMGSLDLQPEITTLKPEGLPGLNQRFEKLLEPTLRLVTEILARMGGDNVDAVRRVASFIQAHQDTLSNVLKDRSTLTLGSLRLLELTTALFSHVATRQDVVEKPFQGSASFQTLMLQLLSRYSPEEAWKVRLQPANEDEKVESKRMLNGIAVLERRANLVVKSILRNVLTYCELITTKNFRPILSWAPSLPVVEAGNWALMAPTGSTPTLGRLVGLLSDVSLELTSCREEVQSWRDWISKGSTDSARLNQFLTGGADLTTIQKQRLAWKQVQHWQAQASRLEDVLFGIVERGLVVLYRHLDYYVRDGHAKPQAVARGFDPNASEVVRIKTELGESSTLMQTLDRLTRLDMVCRQWELLTSCQGQESVGRLSRPKTQMVDMLSRLIRNVLLLEQ